MPRKYLLALLATFSIGLPALADGSLGLIQPNGITLAPLQQQQFTISSVSDVTWSVQPVGMGTITPTGLYTAAAYNGVAFIFAQPAGGGYPIVDIVYVSNGMEVSSPSPALGSTVPTFPGSGSSSPALPPPSPTLPPPAPSSLPSGIWATAPSLSSGSVIQPTSPSAPVADSFPWPPPSGPMIITPASIYLQGGQSVMFTALVQGMPSQQVQWTLTPNLGTIVNGYYTAPASFNNDTQITVLATSLIDSTQTATATVLLGQSIIVVNPGGPISGVGITIAQGPTTLTAGQSAQFTATVTGSSYTGVNWSLTPNVGSVFNGLYTAPANIAVQQTVLLTATSAADPSQTASVLLTLNPASLPPPVVNVSLSPGSASLNGGQSATFTPAVTGTGNTTVTWTLSPQVGSIANGVYQAPAIVASQQNVTITATSVADSTASATATVSLQPVGVTLGPASVTLVAGKSATFAASVTGTGNTAVTWSLSPALGSIVNGVYTAPAIIGSSQQVTLTVASLVDSTKTATATINLIAITLNVSPGSASLNGGQSATFTATVSGASDTAVAWTLSPQVGTISNGVYQAPAIVASQQSVTITATSVADSTTTDTATVTLHPVGVTVGPASASLGAGQSATFTASVTGTSNTAVTWSLNPAVGSIVNGVYTAPATIGTAQTVTVTATSVVDTTKTATAKVTLTPASTSPPPTVTLPLEVIGPNGTTVSTSVTIPSGANLSGQLVLSMQIHGLRTETQASVMVNNSGWLPISDSTVTLLGNATAYGGVGGGFATLKMTMNLAAGIVQTGANTIAFRFNQTDGRVSGFRVLAVNILAADGSSLIPASTFVNEDPNTWQPPSSSASDIAAGQTLWRTAALTTPLITGGSKPILAHCTDCHAQDGRDLKYFNYSNNSIQARALFHGLTAQQGDQIASYIRTLNVANPGRPWNPPYQPGPGLDSQPVITWAAGAGLDAVLDSDQDMVNAIFPSGFQDSVFAATSRLSQREVPLPVQLPDWNQWLPGTHPIDAFGSTFTTSGYYTIYQTLSSSLQVNSASSYLAQEPNLQNWFGAFYDLYVQVGTPIWNNSPASWTPAAVDSMYSLSQWGLVKTWELNNQFQLEGYAQTLFGPQSDPRAWYSNLPFFVSPHELKMPTGGVVGLRNGSADDYNYLSYIWYNLQLILNDSNGRQQEQYPIDWGYSEGFVKAMGDMVAPQAGIETLWMIKGLQILQQSGTGPQLGLAGWQPNVSQPSLLVTEEWNDGVWKGVDPTTRAAIATGIVKSWLQQASQFTPQQFYAGGWTTPTAVPVPLGNAYDNVFPDWVWFMIPRFTFIGVDPSIAAQLAAWAQTIWPNADWAAVQNATCSWQDNTPNRYIVCSQ